jgi:hypothetical protein
MKILREQVTLLLDSGDVVNVDLGTAASVHLLDARLQDQLKQYLRTLAQSKAKDKRSVYIDSSGSAARDLHVSYISPTAIWKSSYRLTMGDSASTLEGWAIVDNTTDDDWNNVKLSVVSGRPISFISLLDTPRYGQRQVAELPEDRAAGPVVYSGSVDAKTDALAYVPGAGLTMAGQSGSGHGMGGGRFFNRNDGTHLGTGAPPAPETPNEFARLEQYANLQNRSITKSTIESVAIGQSSVEGATGATLGELFQYNFAGPVTIKKNQSAMLPFLQDKVDARKLLIYSQTNSEHPVNAAEVTNKTSKTLDGGPITVYDGGAYAGEALFETLKAGDKRLIGYAVDYGTRVTTAFDSSEQSIREIHAADGVVNVKYSQRETRNYTARNVDAKPKTLIIEQASSDGYSLISPKPLERTAKANRFELKLPADSSQTLKVEQEHITLSSYSVMDWTPDFLVSFVTNKQLSENGRKQLQAILDLKKNIVQTDSDLSGAKSQTNDLNGDQNRLRQNIDSLNRVKGQEEQVRKYSSQLSDNEVQLSKLRDQTRELGQRKAAQDAELRGLIDKLEF